MNTSFRFLEEIVSDVSEEYTSTLSIFQRRKPFPLLHDVILHHRVQNGSGAHTASYPVGTRGSFSGGKAAGVWSWPLTST
jgi:hypothetical protein